jgi:hypothetical protein
VGLRDDPSVLLKRITAAQRLGRYLEIDQESTNAIHDPKGPPTTTSTSVPSGSPHQVLIDQTDITHESRENLGTQINVLTTTKYTKAQARQPGQHKEWIANRQLMQKTLRPTETRTREVKTASLSSKDDVAITGVETPLEEGFQEDGMTSSRRVDDGVDNGRSSSSVIGGDADTEYNSVHYTAEHPHKRRRLRVRDVTAPDAEDADKEEAAARIDSNCCIDDDVMSASNVVHATRTRTGAKRTLGQGAAHGSR